MTSSFREGRADSQEENIFWWEGIPLKDLDVATVFAFRGPSKMALTSIGTPHLFTSACPLGLSISLPEVLLKSGS